jgi:UDP-glucose-4-epimerase GalE
MNILVTGGAGYIGSHCCKILAKLGFVPIVYDNLCRGHQSFVRWGPFEYGDILDSQRLTEVVLKYKPEAVIHFAGLAYVGESMIEPARYFRNNVGGSLVLLEVLRSCGVTNLIFSSTCATYGVPEIVPVPESHPQRPINPYGCTKMIVEQAIREFGRAYGLRYVILRYFNAAGADSDGDVGESHVPETHLIPLVLMAAKGTVQEVNIFGNNYDTPDGTCVRDFIHVSDLAEAHAVALKALMAGYDGGVFNVGTGRGHSVREVLDAARVITQRPIVEKICSRREGDPPMLVADSSRIRAALQWQPTRSSLSSILESAWKWTNLSST